MRILSAFLSSLVVSLALPAAAHEFWISPETYTVPAGGQLLANIRVGEKFSGAAYAYNPQRFDRFELVTGDAATAVDGRIGDRPALNATAMGQGLLTIVHETGDSFLTYDDADTFRSFVTHKDFAWALDENTRRGIPEAGFRERYSRYAKSLIGVGDSQGSDREVGLETEIIALANPYTDDLTAGFPVQVLYQSEPRADTQVEVFAKDAAGEITSTLYRTDDTGTATIRVEPGVEYLVDSVVLRPLAQKRRSDPVWESLWASLTFRTPDP